MAAVNYKETATALAGEDGGISEFRYNPKSGRIEFSTDEGREFYMSPAEIGGYGETYLTEEDLEKDAVQEAMEGIEELYGMAEVQKDVGHLLDEEVEIDGSVTMEDGHWNYPESAEAKLN